MLLRLFTAGLLLTIVPALTPAAPVPQILSATSVSIAAVVTSAAPSAAPSASPTPAGSASPGPAPSHVDDTDGVLVPDPSLSSGTPSSPPWIAFGIAAISLAGLGIAFYLAKHRGRHRFSRRNRDSIEYFEGNYYETDY